MGRLQEDSGEMGFAITFRLLVIQTSCSVLGHFMDSKNITAYSACDKDG